MILDKYALYLAKTIKDKSDNNISVDILYYSIAILINILIVFSCVLLIGILSNNVYETIVALSTISLVRIISGGYHFKTITVCSIASTIIILLIIYLPINYSNISMLICMGIYAIIAPNNLERTTNIDKKYYIYFKILSILYIGAEIIYFQSDIIAKGVIAQAISIMIVRKEV